MAEWLPYTTPYGPTVQTPQRSIQRYNGRPDTTSHCRRNNARSDAAECHVNDIMAYTLAIVCYYHCASTQPFVAYHRHLENVAYMIHWWKLEGRRSGSANLRQRCVNCVRQVATPYSFRWSFPLSSNAKEPEILSWIQMPIGITTKILPPLRWAKLNLPWYFWANLPVTFCVTLSTNKSTDNGRVSHNLRCRWRRQESMDLACPWSFYLRFAAERGACQHTL